MRPRPANLAPLLLVLLLAAAPARAEARRALAMVRVPIADLNLADPADARALLRRLDRAAGEICAPLATLLMPHQAGQAYRCRREAVAAAVARLDSPAVRLACAELFPARQPPARP